MNWEGLESGGWFLTPGMSLLGAAQMWRQHEEFEIEKFGLVELKKTKIQQKPLLGQLYLLVTDQGFLTEEKVVWESLHNVDGDGNFCDSEFHLRPPSDPETVYRGQQDQIDQDYLMALSLQQEQQNQEINWEQIPEGISDLELAKKLQEEEDRRASQYYQEQEQAAAQVQQVQGAPSPASGRQSGSNERKRKEPREKEKEKEKNSCVLL
ncbi:PREDICTED: protein FAM63B-like [Chlamydotis macqueenii]|uniref:protein FAM63B-like n=1 Tax=Chlamydotis macqueenii TaxID=187382 RepID=UPI0005298D09|nr:PREDICTED: protein FAM63B-like [Chlamydotis macqueenii]